jgi:hypothetical protein
MAQNIFESWLTDALNEIGADPDAMGPYLTSVLREADDRPQSYIDCCEILEV